MYHDIQARIFLLDLLGKALDRFAACNVEGFGLHPRISRNGCLEPVEPAPRNYNLIALLMKSLGQTSPDSCASASDKNRVPCHSHILLLLCQRAIVFGRHALGGGRSY